MADTVTIRNADSGQERTVPKGALPFFVNQGYEVLDARGHVNPKATQAATAPQKEN